MKVRAVGNTRMVEVLCDARDGQLAASMCNNLAGAYIEYNMESREKSAKKTSTWLESQLDDVRKRLEKAENELKESSKETAFLFDSGSSENAVEDKLREVQNRAVPSAGGTHHQGVRLRRVASSRPVVLPCPQRGQRAIPRVSACGWRTCSGNSPKPAPL